ncbi:fluoride efflux transporter FluC [Oceanobacillus sp. CF4.6]|uniref:fluoride efflux transporter FluC n=1 Tax=Oceanobacillus sp. CF4.6 TaxID=3373080 RepID=UPI003EE7C524
MKLYLTIGIGGMLGASSRYGVSLLSDTNDGFPFSTLLVNLMGCFMLTYLLNHTIIKQRLSPHLFTALTTGVIGSFTTFSALAVEFVQLLGSHVVAAISYVVITFVGGLVFSYLGYQLSTNTGKQVAR